MAKRNLFSVQVEKIGKWWWKETEIDLLGLEKKENRALAVEVRWTNLDYHESKRLISELTAKAQQIHNVKESISGIMAKKIENKDKIRSEGFIAIDLQDIGERQRMKSQN
jgi:AAA+ ATPase superfamily predicted ATPase